MKLEEKFDFFKLHTYTKHSKKRNKFYNSKFCTNENQSITINALNNVYFHLKFINFIHKYLCFVLYIKTVLKHKK